MINKTMFRILIGLTIMMIASPAFAGSQDVFGPEDFTIGNWYLNLSKRNYTVEEPGDGTIRIAKTTPDKNISNGFIFHNWKLIPLREFLRGDLQSIEKDITVKRDNAMVVYLQGDPGASVTIAVANETIVVPPPEISVSADPLSIMLGESTTLSWETTNSDTVTIDQGIGEVEENGVIVLTPTETTTYTIAAAGKGGISSADITITVTRLPPEVELSATPASIVRGESAILSWRSDWAESCVIEPDIGIVDLQGLYTVTPEETTTYTIVATNDEGITQDQAVVQVTEPLPEVSISCDRETIIYGESPALTWTSQNADTCMIEPGIGDVDPDGSVSVTPLETTTYSITASGPGGTVTASITITVHHVPTIQLSANPDTVLVGNETTLSWVSEYADSIFIDNGIGTVAATGSIQLSPEETITYTATVSGPGGTASSAATVTVTWPSPTVTLQATPMETVAGQPVALSWNSTNALSAVLEPGVGGVPVNGSLSVTPAATTTYTLTVSGPGGVQTASRTITVHLTPEADLSATPETIMQGSPAILSWSSQHADICRITPDIGPVDTSGSLTVFPSASTIYTLTAEGPGGSTAATATVTVLPLPTAAISAEKQTIQLGESTQISWTTEHADTISIEPDIGSVSENGSLTVTPDATTMYTITASGPGGTTTGHVAVSVIQLPPQIIFKAMQPVIPAGGSVDISWSSEYADTCSIEPAIGLVTPEGTLSILPSETTTYQLTATGIGGTAREELTITVNQPPAIEIVIPGAPDMAADESCRIQWVDTDVDDNAKILFYYDIDNQSADGTLIVTGIHEDSDGNEYDSYLWDTVDVPKGEYYIYGVIDDQINDPVLVYATASITIDHSASLPDDILSASDADAGDRFGGSVAFHGDHAFIGADGDDENQEDSGAAYVFYKGKTGWTEQVKLMPDDAAAGDHFGCAVVMDGQFAAVGAYGHQGNTGAVYVYLFDGIKWTRQAKLMAEDGIPGDYFGSCLSIRQDMIIVGSYGRESNGPNTGAAFIFQYNGSAWTQMAELSAPDGSAEDYFGGAVAIYGDYALVGAPGADSVGSNAGKAYLFYFDGKGWLLHSELTAPDASAENYFGTSVALGQDLLMIGATGANTDGEAIPGAVYSYSDTGKQWVMSARITAGIPENNGMDAAFFNQSFRTDLLLADLAPWHLTPQETNFGGAISLNEKLAAIRIMREYGANRVRIVESILEDPENPDETPGWKPIAVIASDDTGDGYGDAIQIKDGTLFVGSPEKDGADTDTGEVAVYSIEISSAYDETRLTAGNPDPAPDYFGEAMAADGDRLIVGSSADSVDGSHFGSAHIFIKNGDQWIKQARLTTDVLDYSDAFGAAVDICGDLAIVGAYRKVIDGYEAGAAYIFQNSAGTWSLVAELNGGTLDDNAWFGASVSISNDFAVVGAPNENMGTGAAYIFHNNGTSWEPYGRISRSLEEAVGGDYFSESLDLDGDHLVIGIPGDTEDNGAIIFYRYDGDNWIQAAKFSRAGYEYFGETVALKGNYAIAGRAGDGTDTGAAYIYTSGTGLSGQKPPSFMPKRRFRKPGLAPRLPSAISMHSSDRQMQHRFPELHSSTGMKAATGPGLPRLRQPIRTCTTLSALQQQYPGMIFSSAPLKITPSMSLAGLTRNSAVPHMYTPSLEMPAETNRIHLFRLMHQTQLYCRENHRLCRGIR